MGLVGMLAMRRNLIKAFELGTLCSAVAFYCCIFEFLLTHYILLLMDYLFCMLQFKNSHYQMRIK